MSHAIDKLPQRDPLGVGADKHGGDHSPKHHRSKSCSSGHCTLVNNTTQNGKDQEHRKTSCKATANPFVGQFISSSHCPLCHHKMFLNIKEISAQ